MGKLTINKINNYKLKLRLNFNNNSLISNYSNQG